ncbi:MAG: nucleotidyltransferase domain-containing protein [Nitrososphaerota archaeon]
MFDQYIESGKKILGYLRDYRRVAEAVKRIAMERCRNVRVLVFGSVVDGKATALSDIDVLVICDLGAEERVELKAEIRRRLGYDVPVELHIVSEEEYQDWYRRFMGKFEEI